MASNKDRAPGDWLPFCGFTEYEMKHLGRKRNKWRELAQEYPAEIRLLAFVVALTLFHFLILPFVMQVFV